MHELALAVQAVDIALSNKGPAPVAAASAGGGKKPDVIAVLCLSLVSLLAVTPFKTGGLGEPSAQRQKRFGRLLVTNGGLQFPYVRMYLTVMSELKVCGNYRKQ